MNITSGALGRSSLGFSENKEFNNNNGNFLISKMIKKLKNFFYKEKENHEYNGKDILLRKVKKMIQKAENSLSDNESDNFTIKNINSEFCNLKKESYQLKVKELLTQLNSLLSKVKSSKPNSEYCLGENFLKHVTSIKNKALQLLDKGFDLEYLENLNDEYDLLQDVIKIRNKVAEQIENKLSSIENISSDSPVVIREMKKLKRDLIQWKQHVLSFNEVFSLLLDDHNDFNFIENSHYREWAKYCYDRCSLMIKKSSMMTLIAEECENISSLNDISAFTNTLDSSIERIKNAEFKYYAPCKKYVLVMLQDIKSALKPGIVSKDFEELKKKFIELKECIPVLQEYYGDINDEILSETFQIKTSFRVYNNKAIFTSINNFWAKANIFDITIHRKNVSFFSEKKYTNQYINKVIVDFLFLDNGEINKEIIPTIVNLLILRKPQTISSSNHERILYFLKQLGNDDTDLSRCLNRVAQPADSDQVKEIMAITLDLPIDHKFEKVHVKKIILLALLEDIRQKEEEGSCFVTSILINKRYNDPTLIAQYLKYFLTGEELTANKNQFHITKPVLIDRNIVFDKNLFSKMYSYDIIRAIQTTYDIDKVEECEKYISKYLLKKLEENLEVSLDRYLFYFFNKKTIEMELNLIKSLLSKKDIKLRNIKVEIKNEMVFEFLQEKLLFSVKELLFDIALEKAGLKQSDLDAAKELADIALNLQFSGRLQKSNTKELERYSELLQSIPSDYLSKYQNFKGNKEFSEQVFMASGRNHAISVLEQTLAQKGVLNTITRANVALTLQSSFDVNALRKIFKNKLAIDIEGEGCEILALLKQKTKDHKFWPEIFATVYLWWKQFDEISEYLGEIDQFSIYQIIQKTKGYLALDDSSKEKILEELTTRFEKSIRDNIFHVYEGHFALYCKKNNERIRPNDMIDFASELIQDIYFDLDEAKIFNNSQMNNIRIAFDELCFHLTSSEFKKNLLSIYPHIVGFARNIEDDSLAETLLHEGGLIYWTLDGVDGDIGGGVENKYLKIRHLFNPSSFPSKLVDTIESHGLLNQDKPIYILASNGEHSFNITVDTNALRNFIDDRRDGSSFNEWLKEQTKKDPEYFFIIADTNWEENGRSKYFAVYYKGDTDEFCYQVVQKNEHTNKFIKASNGPESLESDNMTMLIDLQCVSN